MTNIARPPDGLNDLSNGKLTGNLLAIMRFSPGACAYRGTVYCLRCPWGPPAVECVYLCAKCGVRALCACGWESATWRVESWFRLGPYAEVKKMEDQNVGRLRRFQVRGKVYLTWYCNCPDCHASHGQTFLVSVQSHTIDAEGAVKQAIESLGYEFDHVEWQDGPEVEEWRGKLTNAVR